jgi:hypothetical protein
MAKDKLPITKEYFSKRLVDLCLRSGLAGFPKDDVDQHILLKSAALIIGPSGAFTEREIDEKLKFWINNVSQIQKLDHATLRRRLIDTGYLTRNKDGSAYQVSESAPRAELFESGIDQIDVVEVITNAREEIARRKREYMQKARGR